MKVPPRRWIVMSVAGLALAIYQLTFTHATVSAQDPKDRAVSALEQDVKADPNNAELWVHLGFAYRKAGQIDQAQSAFEKAVTLNPRSTDPYFMLGLIYESKNLNDKAQDAWQKYLSGETDPTKRAMAEKHIHHLSQ